MTIPAYLHSPAKAMLSGTTRTIRAEPLIKAYKLGRVLAVRFGGFLEGAIIWTPHGYLLVADFLQAGRLLGCPSTPAAYKVIPRVMVRPVATIGPSRGVTCVADLVICRANTGWRVGGKGSLHVRIGNSWIWSSTTVFNLLALPLVAAR